MSEGNAKALAAATAEPATRLRKRRIALAASGAAIAAIILYFAALVGSNFLLAVRDPPGNADIIVVLGGDGPSRSEVAGALWREGVAPRVLVSGDGDCLDIKSMMVINEGVPAGAIAVECLSRNTWENATLSAPILKADGVRHAVLVTNWFHSKRAIMTFKKAASGIVWTSRPVEREENYLELAATQRGGQVLKEYIKLPIYALLFLLPDSVGQAVMERSLAWLE